VSRDAGAADAARRHLLVVDDDDRIRDLLRRFLVRAGFRVTVAEDAAAARRLFDALSFDLVVVDVMMPGEDGFSLTAWLRKRTAVPVLILTARGLPGDRIEGLSLGADDYLAKPFEPQELLLRIEAVLRRAGPSPAGPRQITLGPLTFDLERAELSRDGAAIRLTESEAAILRALAQNAHAPVDRWDLARPGESDAPNAAEAKLRAVDIHVTRLRKKLEADPRAPRYLQTVRGVGYMLAPD
jgi:two-component system phosphate regulon response regulator OmpR